MTIDYEKLLNFKIPDVHQTRTTKDTMLYALSLGLGHNATDDNELKFVYEKDLQALPTMAVVTCVPHAWLRQSNTGISGTVVHGEQMFSIHRPLPVEGALVGKSQVTGIIDKGTGKGALVYTERKVYNEATGDLICSLEATSFCRGSGGFGGPSGPLKPVHAIPQRSPDIICDAEISSQAALLYRLNGDRNPLHADPLVARKAGYARPILHGLCTLGHAGLAILKNCCGYDPLRLKSLQLRFSSPIFPGESLRTEIWQDGQIMSFQSLVVARDRAVCT